MGKRVADMTEAEYASYRAYHSKYDSHPQRKLKVRNRSLKKNYGITLADYEAMLAAQGGVCAICGTNKPGGSRSVFNVDHCHVSGKVRKLICFACNAGLGCFKDDKATLISVLAYLTSHS